jgi:hypothetical protein
LRRLLSIAALKVSAENLVDDEHELDPAWRDVAKLELLDERHHDLVQWHVAALLDVALELLDVSRRDLVQ